MPGEATLEEAVRQAVGVIGAARYVIALVGAGISAESGVPTFRGPGGLWTRYGEPDMRGYQRFLDDPKGWWEQRIAGSSATSELAQALVQAKPNAGHYALAQLEEMGYLKHVITQNIDNLHQEAGTLSLTEIHGNRHKLRCIDCGTRFPLNQFAIIDELPPRCRQCGGIVKSDTVMFGEPIPEAAIISCRERTYRCDCMLLVGTSAVVYPAAEFPVIAKRRGATLIEINPLATALSELCDVVVRAPAGTALPLMVEQLQGPAV